MRELSQLAIKFDRLSLKIEQKKFQEFSVKLLFLFCQLITLLMCLMSWKPTWKTMWWVSSNTRNMLRVSSVHTTLEKFEKATITGHLGFVFEENSGRNIRDMSWRYRFRKAFCGKCFPSTLKRKAGVFKFLRFKERFRKAAFSFRELMWMVGWA